MRTASGNFSPGRDVVFERVKDYWGEKLNVNVGRDNFDELRFEYFRDTTVALEAFKGDTVDWRIENSAKNWATAYDFPRSRKAAWCSRNSRHQRRRDAGFRIQHPPGEVSGSAGAACVQLRIRLRGDEQADFLRAIQAHRQLFRGHRTGIERTAGGRELEILETVRDKVPPQVFTTPYTNPVGGNPQAVRGNLRDAVRLLKEAGYEIRNERLVNSKTGEPYTVEFLADDPNFERVFLFYKPSLDRLGIGVNVRTVDEAQYENRLRNWDFDIITNSWANRFPQETNSAVSGARRLPTSPARST